MAATDKPLVSASNGKSPQYYNKTTDAYEAVTGEGGATYSIPLGAKVKDVFSGSATITKTYINPMRGFVIMNDDATSDLTFTINSLTLTVKAEEGFDGFFEPYTSVTVTTTVPFRAIVKG